MGAPGQIRLPRWGRRPGWKLIATTVFVSTLLALGVAGSASAGLAVGCPGGHSHHRGRTETAGGLGTSVMAQLVSTQAAAPRRERMRGSLPPQEEARLEEHTDSAELAADASDATERVAEPSSSEDPEHRPRPARSARPPPPRPFATVPSRTIASLPSRGIPLHFPGGAP